MANVITSITGVFTAIAEWIGTAVQSLIPMFYVAESGLTFIGTVSICGLAFSVVFLLVGIIQKFLRFR